MAAPDPVIRHERWIEPEAVFLALAADVPDLFWLDAGAEASHGWSFIGAGARATLDMVAATGLGGPAEPAGPLAGGSVGWLDYELGARAMGLDAERDPDASRWIRADRVVAFDHANRVLHTRGDVERLLAAGDPGPVPPAPDRGTAVGRVSARRPAAPLPRAGPGRAPPPPVPPGRSRPPRIAGPPSDGSRPAGTPRSSPRVASGSDAATHINSVSRRGSRFPASTTSSPSTVGCARPRPRTTVGSSASGTRRC